MSNKYFDSYLSTLNSEELKSSIKETTAEFLDKISTYDGTSHLGGLLLGNVQSGKTGQMLGIISAMADNGYKLFLLLTTDNIYLQEQTEKRARNSLVKFCVIGERNNIDFYKCALKEPTIIILKKNSRILKNWRNNIASTNYAKENPVVVFDDEADAASLNTRINSHSTSSINSNLKSILSLAKGSIYIQVTATPQAILLQTKESGWKPSFVVYFKPGEKYLGGDFFYSTPPPYCIRFTDEEELDEIRGEDSYITIGLRKSLYAYLITTAHFYLKGIDTCNFVIHPSVRIKDHDTFAKKIGEHLNLLLASIDDENVLKELSEAWLDLQKTKPDIENFEDVFSSIKTLLSDQLIIPIVLNSTTPIDVNYGTGYNIVIGGNTLGRGITLPRLQTIYYCRKSKTPQADTYWQHSRIFGYDRDPGLVRIFIPQTLYRLFSELNSSNRNIINQIHDKGIEGIQVLLPPGINPTRKNVIDKSALSMISGGVNYFPLYPNEKENFELDSALKEYSEEELSYQVEIEKIISILEKFNETNDNYMSRFINCIRALRDKRPIVKCRLIVRRGRDIGKGTGTLLSQTDRELGDSFSEDITLTLYKIVGSIEKGWQGKPFWIPNIKLPSDICYYDSSGYFI